MKILAIDIGAGTQDILLFDSTRAPENCIKMIMPSPTSMLADQARQATAAGRGLLLTGVTMGRGPVGRAIEEHLRRGLPVLATLQAARTNNDDLARVQALGVTVTDDAPRAAPGYAHLRLRDLDLDAIAAALAAFGVEMRYDVLAVAVLDHGDAPPDVSDRAFRFEHLRSILAQAGPDGNQLLAFAYTPADLPPYLTRMRAVAQSAGEGQPPIVLLDTGAAAALGALEDPIVAAQDNVLLLNVGNMHTLATHLLDGRIVGLFEHHTGFLTTEKLDAYLTALSAGALQNVTIFDDHGHGCYVAVPPAERRRAGAPFLAVTGPRRALARPGRLRPYFAVPHGDMMIAGCFGLVRACAARLPQWRGEIEAALHAA